MNRYTILAAVAVLSTMAAVSANGICDYAECEELINVNLGEEFNISLESSPGSTGFEWWTKFDTAYLSLANSAFAPGDVPPGMVGVPGKMNFAFKAIEPGRTEVIMLLLQPWTNGTIGDSKIFPVSIDEQINVRRGEEFNISLESSPGSTGFEWWAKFDTAYLSLVDSTFVPGDAPAGMVGQPGKMCFTFDAKEPGSTEVIMLLLRPWVNGTIAERKILPVRIE
jgi:predicted secreted protein